MISRVLIGEWDDEKAIARIFSFPETGGDLGLNPIHDLIVERRVVIGEINTRLRPAGLCNEKRSKQHNKGSRFHIDQLATNAVEFKKI
jgi:hypothetical protein